MSMQHTYVYIYIYNYICIYVYVMLCIMYHIFYLYLVVDAQVRHLIETIVQITYERYDWVLEGSCVAIVSFIGRCHRHMYIYIYVYEYIVFYFEYTCTNTIPLDHRINPRSQIIFGGFFNHEESPVITIKLNTQINPH